MLSVLAYRAAVNAFKDIIFVKSLYSGLCLEFKLSYLGYKLLQNLKIATLILRSTYFPLVNIYFE